MNEHVFIPLDIGVPKDSYGPTFTAQYDNVCPTCGCVIVAEETRIRQNKITYAYVHEICPETDEFAPNHKPSYTVKGARKPKLCSKCQLEHAGDECP